MRGRLTKGIAALVTVAAMAAHPRTASATGQAPDIIVLDGREYSLTVNPLETYFESHPRSRPESGLRSSGNWRGYVASFTVIDGRLMVTDIITLDDVSVFRRVFPGTGPVLVSWFTGHLIVPDGKITRYVHMGYASEYSRYIVLRVAKGVVTSQRRLTGEEFQSFRRAQFDAFKGTLEFRRAAREIKADALPPAQREAFLYEFMSGLYVSRLFD